VLSEHVCVCEGVGSRRWDREGFPVKRRKGARWMPRHGAARKDVVSCEKRGGGARIL
jgi:hypothetical protein